MASRNCSRWAPSRGLLRTNERVFALRPRLARIGLPDTERDQVTQAVEVGRPSVDADVVALVRGHEPDVGEADFRLAGEPRDLEHDVGVLPLGIVAGEAEIVVEHGPHDLLSR